LGGIIFNLNLLLFPARCKKPSIDHPYLERDEKFSLHPKGCNEIHYITVIFHYITLIFHYITLISCLIFKLIFFLNKKKILPRNGCF